MDDMKLLSTEAEGVNEAIPEEHRKALVNAAGRVGALLGLQCGSGAEPGSPQENGDADDAGKSKSRPLSISLLHTLHLGTLCGNQERFL